VIRRLWALFADPPSSDDARLLLYVVLPFAFLLAVARLCGWWVGIGPSLADVMWLCFLLQAVRERDEARQQSAELRRALQMVGHQRSS
jgi:hypothetical protein